MRICRRHNIRFTQNGILSFGFLRFSFFVPPLVSTNFRDCQLSRSLRVSSPPILPCRVYTQIIATIATEEGRSLLCLDDVLRLVVFFTKSAEPVSVSHPAPLPAFAPPQRSAGRCCSASLRSRPTRRAWDSSLLLKRNPSGRERTSIISASTTRNTLLHSTQPRVLWVCRAATPAQARD